MTVFTCRDQGALEDAATAAQRQLEDCRTALAAAQAECKLAQATAEAISKERNQLLQHLAQEMNKSTLVEQVSSADHRRICILCTNQKLQYEMRTHAQGFLLVMCLDYNYKQ